MADSWTNYLYHTHEAVAVSLLMSEPSLNPLDVLVKSTSRNVLQHVGSMVDLGTPESAETAALLRMKLQNFKSGTVSAVDRRDQAAPQFKWSEPRSDYCHIVTSGASVKSSLKIFHNGVDLDLDGEKQLQCNLRGLKSACVGRPKLLELIHRSKWTPNMEELRRIDGFEPTGGVLDFFRNRVYEIWVIYEVLYARDIDVALVDSTSGSGGASSSAAGGPPLAANVQASATRQTIIRSRAQEDEMKPFGFRAIHAQYDAEGKFCKLEVHAGQNPIEHVRGAESDFLDQRTVLKGLSGLFLNPPGDEEDLLECLEIVVR